MNRILKGLAIAVLLVTVAAAGAVLYGLHTMTPQVASVQVSAVPAVQAQDTYDEIMRQIDEGTFAGRVFAQTQGLYPQDCTFLTYTVRLRNRGFFPAEWVSVDVEPAQQAQLSYDVLQVGGNGANVLPAGSEGDLSATILRVGDASSTARNLRIVCYVFGQRMEFTVQTQ